MVHDCPDALILCCGAIALSYLFTDASGIGIADADLPINPRAMSLSGQKNSRAMSPAITAPGRSYIALGGVLSSCGNAKLRTGPRWQNGSALHSDLSVNGLHTQRREYVGPELSR
jgi:hypothetical protein